MNAAFAKFDKALAEKQHELDAKSKGLADEAQKALAKDPNALTLKPDQVFLLQYWMTGKDEEGKPLSLQRVAIDPIKDVFEALRTKSFAAEKPIDEQGAACERRIPDCDPKAIYRTRRPIRVKYAGDIANAWPRLLDAVHKNLAWDALPPLRGLDVHALPVRMQIEARDAEQFEDIHEFAEIARTFVCVQTAKLESPAH